MRSKEDKNIVVRINIGLILFLSAFLREMMVDQNDNCPTIILPFFDCLDKFNGSVLSKFSSSSQALDCFHGSEHALSSHEKKSWNM
jgi:hypothetical protein